MNSKVIIHKCADPAAAMNIAREIARWTGKSPEMIVDIVMSKTTCIRRDADPYEAQRLKEQYEALGAAVELIPCDTTQMPLPFQTKISSVRDDDEDDAPAKVISKEEYLRKMNERKDIFYLEKEKKQQLTELVACVCGVVFSVFLGAQQTATVTSDFLEKVVESANVQMHTEAVEIPKPNVTKETPKVEKTTDQKSLKAPKHQGNGGTTGGGGDPRSRVTMKGVLGIISGQIKGKTVASADIFGKGGFATGIDAILSGVGGLKAGGSGGVGRAGAAGIGYGLGYNSGMGGGSGGIGDLVDNLMSSTPGIGELKHRGTLQIKPADIIHSGALVGGRSKASILRVVMQNLAVLRYAYNKRLKEKPGLEGKVTVKFAIDEYGKVIFCELNQTTVGDSELEKVVLAKIRSWVFDKIDKPGDVTEVIYPFVFSQ